MFRENYKSTVYVENWKFVTKTSKPNFKLLTIQPLALRCGNDSTRGPSHYCHGPRLGLLTRWFLAVSSVYDPTGDVRGIFELVKHSSSVFKACNTHTRFITLQPKEFNFLRHITCERLHGFHDVTHEPLREMGSVYCMYLNSKLTCDRTRDVQVTVLIECSESASQNCRAIIGFGHDPRTSVAM